MYLRYRYQKNVTMLLLQLQKKSNVVTSKINKKVTYNCNTNSNL